MELKITNQDINNITVETPMGTTKFQLATTESTDMVSSALANNKLAKKRRKSVQKIEKTNETAITRNEFLTQLKSTPIKKIMQQSAQITINKAGSKLSESTFISYVLEKTNTTQWTIDEGIQIVGMACSSEHQSQFLTRYLLNQALGNTQTLKNLMTTHQQLINASLLDLIINEFCLNHWTQLAPVTALKLPDLCRDSTNAATRIKLAIETVLKTNGHDNVLKEANLTIKTSQTWTTNEYEELACYILAKAQKNPKILERIAHFKPIGLAVTMMSVEHDLRTLKTPRSTSIVDRFQVSNRELTHQLLSNQLSLITPNQSQNQMSNHANIALFEIIKILINFDPKVSNKAAIKALASKHLLHPQNQERPNHLEKLLNVHFPNHTLTRQCLTLLNESRLNQIILSRIAIPLANILNPPIEINGTRCWDIKQASSQLTVNYSTQMDVLNQSQTKTVLTIRPEIKIMITKSGDITVSLEVKTFKFQKFLRHEQLTKLQEVITKWNNTIILNNVQDKSTAPLHQINITQDQSNKTVLPIGIGQNLTQLENNMNPLTTSDDNHDPETNPVTMKLISLETDITRLQLSAKIPMDDALTLKPYKVRLSKIKEAILNPPSHHDLISGGKLTSERRQTYWVLNSIEYQNIMGLAEEISHVKNHFNSCSIPAIECKVVKHSATGDTFIALSFRLSKMKINKFKTEITTLSFIADHAIIRSKQQTIGVIFIASGHAQGSQAISFCQPLIGKSNIQVCAKLCLDLIEDAITIEENDRYLNAFSPTNFFLDKTKKAHWFRLKLPKSSTIGTITTKPLISEKYLAPELLNQATEASVLKNQTKQNAWTLGITLYEVWHGEKPFLLNHAPANENGAYISTNTLIIKNVPLIYEKVLRGLLKKKPTERWTIKQVNIFLKPK